MSRLTCKEAKSRFGYMIDEARVSPVTITNHNRPVAVVMSIDRYEELERLEDAIWLERAKAAAERGYATPAEYAEAVKRLVDDNV